MVTQLMSSRPNLSTLCIAAGNEQSVYRVQDGVLKRGDEILHLGRGDPAAREAFAGEAVFLVRAVQDQVVEDIGRFCRALDISPFEYSGEEVALLFDSLRRSLMQPDLNAAQDPLRLRVKVLNTQRLLAAENRLQAAVIQHGKYVVDLVRYVGVPDMEWLADAVEKGDVDTSALVFENWPHWCERYNHELQVVNTMLNAVAMSLPAADSASDTASVESRDLSHEYGYRHATSGWEPVIASTEPGYFDRRAQFIARQGGGLLTAAPVTGIGYLFTYALKDGQGFRDDIAIQGLLDGMAFEIVYGSLVGVHALVDQQYKVLASSPLYGQKEREQLEGLAKPHENFRVPKDWNVPVTEENIGKLVSVAREVVNLHAEATHVSDEILEHAALMAAAIRERHDTGEDTVELGEGWEIRTLTRPVDSGEPEQRRVIGHAKFDGQPVERVPWLAKNRELTAVFLCGSRQMLTAPLGSLGPAHAQVLGG